MGIAYILLAIVMDAGVLYFDHDKTALIISGLVVSLLFWWAGFYHIRSFIIANIERQNDIPEGATELEKRIAQTRERRKGKNMFVICDGVAMAYKIIMIVFLCIFALSFPYVIISEMNKYPAINIPYYWCFIIAIVLLLISVLIGIKSDIAFKSSRDLKAVMRKKGLDEIRVNIDFMMANYHDMHKGLLAIGQSYYVVFTQKFCDVSEIRDIVRVESYSRNNTYPANDDDSTRYFVRIVRSKMTTYLMCADKIAAELVLREFKMKGIETRVCGDETGKPK